MSSDSHVVLTGVFNIENKFTAYWICNLVKKTSFVHCLPRFQEQGLRLLLCGYFRYPFPIVLRSLNYRSGLWCLQPLKGFERALLTFPKAFPFLQP